MLPRPYFYVPGLRAAPPPYAAAGYHSVDMWSRNRPKGAVPAFRFFFRVDEDEGYGYMGAEVGTTTAWFDVYSLHRDLPPLVVLYFSDSFLACSALRVVQSPFFSS